MSILVVGSVGIDTLETPEGKRDEILGGSACHFSLAASAFSKSIRIVGVVGTDFPEEYSKLLEDHGVDLEGLERVEGDTFRWHGRYEEFGTAISLATHLNVFEAFDPKIPETYKESDIVFLGNIAPGLQEKVLTSMPKPRLTVMDTMNFWISSQKDAVMSLFGKVDVAIVNDQEAKDLTGENHAYDAGVQLLDTGAKMVIVKKGEHGALLISKDDFFITPSFPSSTILDTTGAGDSFAGGFCGYLDSCEDIDKMAIRRAVVYGCILGSMNIEGFGPERTAEITHEDVEERFAYIKKVTAF